MDMRYFLTKFSMRKIQKIINIALISMLILGGGLAYSADITCLRIPLKFNSPANERDPAWGEPTEEGMHIAEAYLDAWNKLNIDDLMDIYYELLHRYRLERVPGEISPCVLFFSAITDGLDGVGKINLDSASGQEKVLDIYKAICKINPDWAAYMFLDK